jgi:hypothetical protein
MSINVYSFADEEGKHRYLVYHSRFNFDKKIDLLFFDDHYAWIKNFDRFVSDISKTKRRQHFCKLCFNHFYKAEALEKHQLHCQPDDKCEQLINMPPPGSDVKFNKAKNTARAPFIIYADFESILEPPDEKTSKKRKQAYQVHKPCSVGLKLISIHPELSLPYESQFGEDVVDHFFNKLMEYEKYILDILYKPVPMSTDPVEVEEIEFKLKYVATCCICEKFFEKGDIKVKYFLCFLIG